MNLSDQQREYARTLTPGYAVARNQYGRPVHIKVPEFDDQPGFAGLQRSDISDQAIEEYMSRRRHELQLQGISVVPWQSSLSARTGERGASPAPQEVMSLLLAAPMQSCAFCVPLHETKKCPYGAQVRRRFIGTEAVHEPLQQQLQRVLGEPDGRKRHHELQDLVASVNDHVQELDETTRQGMIYCYVAHEVEALAGDLGSRSDGNRKRLSRGRGILQQMGREIRTRKEKS